MTSRPDQFAWWRQAIAGTIGDVREDDPQPGFYRVAVSKDQNGTKTFHPIAFWYDKNTGHLRCLYDGKEVADLGKQSRIWIACAKTPVPKASYDTKRKTGVWPDDVAAEDEAPRAPRNLPDDPFLALEMEINDLVEQSEKWLATTVIDEKVKADKARNWQAMLQALKKRADEMRDAEKRPHLEAGRAVDAKFKPLIEHSDGASRALKAAYEKWAVTEEARLKAEAQAKFEKEKAAAEAARREIEAQRAKQMADDPIAALTSPEPDLPDIPDKPDEVKVQVGGGTGARAGLTTVYEPTITDWALCLDHYKDHPNIRAVVEKLVAAETKLHKAATKIPGVEVKAVRKAK